MKKDDEKVSIEKEVFDEIYKCLEDQGGLNKFDNILVEDRPKEVVFDTVMRQVGTWYHCDLLINKSFFEGLSKDEINEVIKMSKATVCENISDCITHEISHAKQSENALASVVKKYNDTDGVKGISANASKDMLESLSEAEVLRKKGLYGTIPEESRNKLEVAAKELKLW